MNLGKFLIVIPIIFFSYIAYANLVTVDYAGQGSDNHDVYMYFIDIGTENDTIGDAKLGGPMDRVSVSLEEAAVPSNTTYRELTSSLVYFQITHSDLINHSKINVQIRFKDNFPQGYDFKLGARNKEEWSFQWKAVYDPSRAKLEETFHLAASNDSYRIYSVNNQEIKNVSGFLLHPPSGSNIAVEPDIKIKVNTEPDIAVNRSASLTINRTLRGGHTFYTCIDNETLEFTVTKQDMNWYNGSEDLKITVYSNSGEEKGNITIPDDGDTSNSNAMGPKQTRTISIPGLETGVYKIIMAGGEDMYIQNISTEQDKLVADHRLFVISPTEIYTMIRKEQNIGFLTYHASAFQDIRIQNDTLSASVKIDRCAINYKTRMSPVGELYDISLPVGDMIITSDGYFAFTSDSYFNPTQCSVLTLQNDMDWIKNSGIDYIIINSLNTTDDNGWVIAEAEWDMKDLWVNKDTLDFATNTEHFTKYPNSTIPVDWIRITLT